MNKDTLKENLSVYDDDTIIVIEKTPPRTESHNEVVVPAKPLKRHLAAWIVAIVIVVLLIIILTLLLTGHSATRDADNAASELPTSASAEQNTELLQSTNAQQTTPAVILTTDTINDVSFRLYAIRGLYAELTFDRPRTTDKSVYLSVLSADQRADNGEVMCACIMDGEQVSRGNSRSGYFAAVGENMVIGVATNDSIMDYARTNKGYFFRQFAIVSDGQIGDVRLKGKAPRSAIGKKDGQLIYVESQHRESLYDFAEALCDYGFTDALYLPNGGYVTSHRDSTGTWHTLYPAEETMLNDAPQDTTAHRMPRLVFRAKATQNQ